MSKAKTLNILCFPLFLVSIFSVIVVFHFLVVKLFKKKTNIFWNLTFQMLKNVSTFKKKYPSDFSAKAVSATEPNDRNRFHSPVTRFLSLAWRWWSVPDAAVSALGSLLFLPLFLHNLTKPISIVF